jgi:hypothetical protein
LGSKDKKEESPLTLPGRKTIWLRAKSRLRFRIKSCFGFRGKKPFTVFPGKKKLLRFWL